MHKDEVVHKVYGKLALQYDGARRAKKIRTSKCKREDFVMVLKEYSHFDYGNAGWALEKGKDYAMYEILESEPTIILDF